MLEGATSELNGKDSDELPFPVNAPGSASQVM